MNFVCFEDICPALTANGFPMYRDYDHLSEYALTHEVRYLDPLLLPQQSAAR